MVAITAYLPQKSVGFCAMMLLEGENLFIADIPPYAARANRPDTITGKTRKPHRIIPAMKITPPWKAIKEIKLIANDPMINKEKMVTGTALVVRKEPRNKDNKGLSLTTLPYDVKLFVLRFIAAKRWSHSESRTFTSHWELLRKKRKFFFYLASLKNTA